MRRTTPRFVENALEFRPRFCRRTVSGRRAADTGSAEDHQLTGTAKQGNVVAAHRSGK